MKLLVSVFVMGLVLMPNAHARDTIAAYSLESAFAHPETESVLGTGMSYYFGEQMHPEIIEDLGEIRVNKKTSAFGKSDQEACEWVFLSAMKALKAHAVKRGGNAVINIKSNYKNNLTSSNDSFQCGAGALIAGVALVGRVVKVKK